MSKRLRRRDGMHRTWSFGIGSEDTQLLPWNDTLGP